MFPSLNNSILLSSVYLFFSNWDICRLSNLESYFVDDIAQLKKILPEHNIGWFNNGKNT